MIVSFILAVYLQLIHPSLGFEPLEQDIQFLISVFITTIAWVSVSLLTRPSNINTLKDFYIKIQPGGKGWNKVKAQIDEKIDSTKTALGEQVQMVEGRVGGLNVQLEGFNDDLSVQTEAVATLTAVKHDTFAQNILDLVAENAARLGLIGNAPQKVDERALQRKFMESLATINLVTAQDDQFVMADGVRRAVAFVDAETQDATARSKCDELNASIEQLEASLKEAIAARDAALRQESSERRKQDKAQSKERAKDALSARDAAVAAEIPVAHGIAVSYTHLTLPTNREV